jgi:acid stress-induced BolA-like protein IbaG/YrbA
MDLTIKRLRQALEEKFPDAETELERFPGTKKIGGYLIWDGFEGFDQLERQQLLSNALRESLGDDYRSRVTTIFTLTPAENMVMREG